MFDIANRSTASREKWRPVANARSGPVPVDVSLAWLSIESDGVYTTSYYGALGLFQLNAEEAKLVGIDLARTISDPDYSFDAGISYITKYAMPKAEAAIKRNNLGWTDGESYWGMVKLAHALPVGLDLFPQKFRAANGTNPSSYRELMAWVGKQDWSGNNWGSQVPSVIDNTLTIARAAPSGSYVGLLLLAAAGYGLYRWLS